MKPLFNAVFGRLVPGVVFLMTLATAHAQSTVKYLGTQDDMIVFNVSNPNPDGNKFQLTIKDQDGSTLYQNVFADKSFFKQFRLPKAEKDRIVFIFHDYRGADVVKTFEVNVDSRFVREIAIKKVD